MANIKNLLKDDVQLIPGKATNATSIGALRAAGVKSIGLYYSAHWCPPCRGFTPALAEMYSAMVEAGRKDVEIIFVSCDRDEKTFTEYHNTMGFAAFPFQATEIKQSLMEALQVSGIPTLATVDLETGAVITKEGRNKATSDKKGESFPWR